MSFLYPCKSKATWLLFSACADSIPNIRHMTDNHGRGPECEMGEPRIGNGQKSGSRIPHYYGQKFTAHELNCELSFVGNMLPSVFF